MMAGIGKVAKKPMWSILGKERSNRGLLSLFMTMIS